MSASTTGPLVQPTAFPTPGPSDLSDGSPGRGAGDRPGGATTSAVAALACGAGFLLLVVVLLATDVMRPVDAAGTVAARRWAADHPGSRVLGMAQLGDVRTVVALVALVATAAALGLRRWRPLVGAAGALLLLAALVESWKYLLGRVAPTFTGQRSEVFFGDNGYAFPSGHTAGALVGLGLVALLLTGRGGLRPSPVLLRVLLTVTAVAGLAVGVVTVTLGWHWPSDVAGGALLSGVVLAAASRLLAGRATPPS